MYEVDRLLPVILAACLVGLAVFVTARSFTRMTWQVQEEQRLKKLRRREEKERQQQATLAVQAQKESAATYNVHAREPKAELLPAVEHPAHSAADSGREGRASLQKKRVRPGSGEMDTAAAPAANAQGDGKRARLADGRRAEEGSGGAERKERRKEGIVEDSDAASLGVPPPPDAVEEEGAKDGGQSEGEEAGRRGTAAMAVGDGAPHDAAVGDGGRGAVAEGLRSKVENAKVPELREWCRKAGLPVSGRKADLVSRCLDSASVDKVARALAY